MNENSSGQNLPYRRGREPQPSPAVRPWSVLLAMALLGASFVAAREAWLLFGDGNAQSWLRWFFAIMETDALQDWMVWAGAGAVALGLVFLFVALKPRKSTHIDYSTEFTSMWTRPVDVARRVAAAARTVPGVAAARSNTSAKKVSVIINGDAEDPTLAKRTTAALEHTIEGLRPRPELTVHYEQTQEVDNNV